MNLKIFRIPYRRTHLHGKITTVIYHLKTIFKRALNLSKGKNHSESHWYWAAGVMTVLATQLTHNV